MINNRRKFLIQSGAALASLGSIPAVTESIKDRDNQKSIRSLYDWSKPEHLLNALIKVIGDFSGAEVWLSAEGVISAIQPDETPLEILAVDGLRRVRCEKITNGYRLLFRDWVIYKDIETGKPVDSFKNPITGKLNQVSHILTSLHPLDISLEEVNELVSLNQQGDDLVVSFKVVSKRGGEWLHLMTSSDELNNPSLKKTSARYVWTGHSPWLSWMEMGDYPGLTLWQSSGRKQQSKEQLSPDLITAINRYYPGSLDAPETYQKPS